ncbi:MAG: ketoacyl-ACP synthase III [Planctomycetes bacterium]|nr:ketoacyl-ACP synthase III [Planctomycetota bacterium]
MSLPRSVKIVGTGHYVPERIMTNDDFARLVDTSDEWITTRTGIKERRIAAENEATSDLAVAAAREALKDAGREPADVDLVIIATITPDHIFPATAALVQYKLGIPKCGGFDLEAACSGFVCGVAMARGAILAGICKRALVVGAEKLSAITNYKDRASCILFGDGAGAALLEGSDEPDTGVIYNTLGIDGVGGHLMITPAGGVAQPVTHANLDEAANKMTIHGREVYRFAVDKMQYLVRDAMEHCNLSVDDVAMVVPHQVNTRIIDSAVGRLGFPAEKIFVNIDKYGNTSAASVPIALSEARRQGSIRDGQTAILVAFGGGLSWASAVVKF